MKSIARSIDEMNPLGRILLSGVHRSERVPARIGVRGSGSRYERPHEAFVETVGQVVVAIPIAARISRAVEDGVASIEGDAASGPERIPHPRLQGDFIILAQQMDIGVCDIIVQKCLQSLNRASS